jgi:hypothetical protein
MNGLGTCEDIDRQMLSQNKDYRFACKGCKCGGKKKKKKNKNIKTEKNSNDKKKQETADSKNKNKKTTTYSSNQKKNTKEGKQYSLGSSVDRQRTIVVSNVPPDLPLDECEIAFSAVGKVEYCDVVQDKAAVLFSSSRVAQKAVEAYQTFTDVDGENADAMSCGETCGFDDSDGALCAIRQYDVTVDPGNKDTEFSRGVLPVRVGELFFLTEETKTKDKSHWIWLRNRRGELGWVPKSVKSLGATQPVLAQIPEDHPVITGIGPESSLLISLWNRLLSEKEDGHYPIAEVPEAILCDILNGGALSRNEINVTMA